MRVRLGVLVLLAVLIGLPGHAAGQVPYADPEPEAAGMFVPLHGQDRNGRIPAHHLAPIYQGRLLAGGTAAGWNSMNLYRATIGLGRIGTNGPDSSYRTFSRQVFWQDYWCRQGACGNAATPGRSNHGLGRAVDTNGAWWVKRYGRNFGWGCSDAPHESWHVIRCFVYGRPDPGPNVTYPTLRHGSGGPGQLVHVRRLERRLRFRRPDGEYRRNTADAVRRAERRCGFKRPDGATTRATWLCLGRAPKPRPLSARTIDVSGHQRAIDWRAVKRAGIRGAWIKLSEGQDYADPAAHLANMSAPRARAALPVAKAEPGSAKHVSGARAAGVPYGFYHFLRPRAGRSGAVEARFFVRLIRERGGPGSLRPVADVETTTLGPAATCRYTREFHAELQRHVRKRLTYTAFYFWRDRAASCNVGTPLWVAHYGVSKPLVPAPWKTYAAWQITDQGSVAGVSGPVDINLVPDLRRVLR